MQMMDIDGDRMLDLTEFRIGRAYQEARMRVFLVILQEFSWFSMICREFFAYPTCSCILLKVGNAEKVG